MRLSKPVWRAMALVVTVAFFWLALRSDVYNATSPRGLTRAMFGSDVIQVSHPWWLSVHIWLRKLYSIVAFAIIGFTVESALGPAARPALRAAIIVGTFSFGVEVAQRLFVASEPNLESALDIVCGALGGWLAVFGPRLIRSRRSLEVTPHVVRDV